MDFKAIIDITKANRQLFVDLVSGLTEEQLNHVPAGFNNNIAWNFGHIVVSQQALCYFRVGLTPLINPTYIPKYARGSKPESLISRSEINDLIKLSDTLIESFEKDYENNSFIDFKPYTTLYGVYLENIDKAFAYSATHDMQHFGIAMALRKLV